MQRHDPTCPVDSPFVPVSALIVAAAEALEADLSPICPFAEGLRLRGCAVC